VVTHIRLKEDAGSNQCGLVIDKSLVAPIKAITIARMELTAAVVSFKLHKNNLYCPFTEQISGHTPLLSSNT